MFHVVQHIIIITVSIILRAGVSENKSLSRYTLQLAAHSSQWRIITMQGCGHCMEEMCVWCQNIVTRNKVWGQKHLTIYHPSVQCLWCCGSGGLIKSTRYILSLLLFCYWKHGPYCVSTLLLTHNRQFNDAMAQLSSLIVYKIRFYWTMIHLCVDLGWPQPGPKWPAMLSSAGS